MATATERREAGVAKSVYYLRPRLDVLGWDIARSLDTPVRRSATGA